MEWALAQGSAVENSTLTRRKITQVKVRAFFTTYNNCFAKTEILENGGSKADCQNSGLPSKMPSRSLQFEIGKA